MAYEVIWSSEAEKTFESQLEYLLAEWNEKAVRSFLEKTERTISIIAKSPFIFKCSEKQGMHQVMIGKYVLLYYDVNPSLERVELLSFWGAMQDPDYKPDSKKLRKE